MRIVFMGSSEFATPTLSTLANTEHDIVAVYTKAPTHSGRGLKQNKNIVQIIAEEFSLEILTPHKLQTTENIKQFNMLKPDIAVVAAYGLLVPKEFLQTPKYGFINIHPSSLPRWRGAAPIERTIMAGDKKTAVCIIKMDEGLDTGDIILQQEFQLDNKITAKELHDKCAHLGSELVINTLNLIKKNKLSFTKQSQDGVVYAKKICNEEKIIDFHSSAERINCQIRALSPRPGAYFIYKGEKIKIITAEIGRLNHEFEPGMVIDNQLSIACKENLLKPILLQREGKKMIYKDAFLRGFDIPSGTKLVPNEYYNDKYKSDQ